jgi:hypothetical protein
VQRDAVSPVRVATVLFARVSRRSESVRLGSLAHPSVSFDNLHVRYVRPVSPSVNKFFAIFRRGEKFQAFHFHTAGPVARFDLAEHNIGRPDTDDVPRTQRGRTPHAAVPCRFQHCYRAMFVPLVPFLFEFNPVARCQARRSDSLTWSEIHRHGRHIRRIAEEAGKNLVTAA